MAKQYEGAIKSINNDDWTVELHSSAAAATRVLTIAGININRDGEGDKLYENPIRPSRASVNFVMRDENDYGNFILIGQDPEQEWSLRLYKNGDLWWVGRVLADQMQFDREARETGYAIITITAVDGLNLLENYKVDPAWFSIGDRQDIITLIVQILGTVGLQDAWSSDTYIYDQTQITNSTASGERVMFDTVRSLSFINNFDIFKDESELEWMDCKTALENILNGVLMGARIMHDMGGYWIVHPANYNSDTWTYDSYDETGTPLLLDTGFNHRKSIDTDSQRPKFDAYPTMDFLPPIRVVDIEYDRENGVLESRTTFNTTALTLIHDDIVTAASAPGRMLKMQIDVDINYYNTSVNYYVLRQTIYAKNPSSGQKYAIDSNGYWIAMTTIPYLDIKIDDSQTTQNNRKFSNVLTVTAPPTGATEVHVEVEVLKGRSGFTSTSWVLSGGVFVPIVVYTPPAAPTSTYFRGNIAISQSYTSTEPFQYTQKYHVESTLDAPRDNNSLNPTLKTNYYSGRGYDVGGVRVYNGSNYVDAGNWGAPWTAFTGDLPSLYANTVAGLHPDFRQKIKCTIEDDGTLNAIDSLYFDSQIWVLNGCNYNIDLDKWEGEWVSIQTVYTNVNNNGEGERVKGRDDIIVDTIGDIKLDLSRIRGTVGNMPELLKIDMINNGEGAPTTDPGVDTDYNLKLGYRENSGEPYLTWKIEDAGNARWTLVKKTSDQVKNNDTTAAADTSLTLTIPAGYNYTIRGRIFVTGDAAADFKYFFDLVGSYDRFQWVEKYLTTDSGVTPTDRIITTPDTVASNVIAITDRTAIEFEGTIESSTGCSITLKWAQNTADASDTTVLMGSYLEWMRFVIPAVYNISISGVNAEVAMQDVLVYKSYNLAISGVNVEVQMQTVTASVVDADAAAIISATGASVGAEQDYVNYVVSSLKNATSGNLWTLSKAVYGYVGGSASAHKFNWKDPQDTDAAHRISMVGGLTHDANGVTGNGSTGFMNPHFTDADFNGQNDAGVVVYCRNDFASGAKALYGAIDSSFNGTRFLPDLSGTAYFSVFSGTGGGLSNSDTSGCWIHSRTGSSADVMYRNGSVFKTNNVASSTNTTTANILILAIDYDNGALQYQQSDANIAFFAFTDGLTEAQAIEYNDIVIAANAILSR